MTGKNNANKVGAHGRQEHPTNSQINDVQTTQGPPVYHNPKDHEFLEQRDTMKPKHGEMLSQQKAQEIKEDGREDEMRGVDLHMHGERDDEKQMPVPPAQKKAGMRT